jgi:DNA-binding MarR family transcriptional regulator
LLAQVNSDPITCSGKSIPPGSLWVMSTTDRQRSLDSEQLQTWAALATLLERLPAALDAQLQRDSGLTHFEHGVLYALDTAPGRTLRMSTLAGYASSTLSRLSRAVTRLERHGWVRREPDPSDGRFTLAILTEHGHDKVRSSTPAHHALVQQLVFGSMTQTQARQLRTISQRISNAVDAAPAWHPQASTGQDTGPV